MKKILIRSFVGLLFFLPLMPYITWQIQEGRELSVMVVDKTVSDDSYREHRGITYALNHYKYSSDGSKKYDIEEDYWGFVPKEDNGYEIRDIEEGLMQRQDLIYLADTYGVYKEELLNQKRDGKGADIVYGGLSLDEVELIKEKVYREKTSLVAEFNSFATPTGKSARDEISKLLGVEWSGWTGRYFKELNPVVNSEVMSWTVESYESQSGEKWSFSGEGFILVSEKDEIIVLKKDKDYDSDGIKLEFTEKGKEFFDIESSVGYNYWFDIVYAKDADIYAEYSWDLSKSGEDKFAEYGIPKKSAAITRAVRNEAPAYYFAGDFNDMKSVSRFYRYRWLSDIMKVKGIFQKNSEDRFYWETYLPMMEKILDEAHKMELDFKIYLDGIKLETGAEPYAVKQDVMLPAKMIFENLGIETSIDADGETLTAMKDGSIVKLQVGSKEANINGEKVQLEVAPEIVDGKIMAPLKFIASSVGGEGDWNELTKEIYIDTELPFKEDGIRYVAKVEGKDFSIYKDGKWEKTFLKGVNMGVGKPGHFPGELAITKEEYLRWFKYISDMNADVIRVYTTLDSNFYDALLEHNRKSEKPIYIIQGVWVREEDKEELKEAYAENERFKENFIKDAEDLVDVFHGRATLPERAGFASGEYKSDISKYVIGWIMGIEWDPEFVKNTNESNKDKNSYSGEYLELENAPAYEVFLGEVGDAVLKYEAENYGMTRPLSFSNWATTDMLKHTNEPYLEEDMAEVNMEHIKITDKNKTGIFASYHVYPYYPEFMNFQRDYREFIDEDGKINAYKAYLRDLISHHTMPVLLAEVGVPSSRGKAHFDINSGLNQGNHDETRQGEIVKGLVEDIYDEGYCGAMIFAWQDEWFKRTWNTMEFNLPDRRPFWSDPQTNEQKFGLLAFDPGEEKSVCYVDGDTSEWSKDDIILEDDKMSLSVKSDEKYIYLMVEADEFDFEKDKLYIPIDSIQGQGNKSDDKSKLSFARESDMLIKIDGAEDSRIMVDAYYDSHYYIYAEDLKMIDRKSEYTEKNSGIFNQMKLCLSSAIYLPEDDKVIPFMEYETGKLKMGNANPEDKEFNSLTDFSYSEGNVEIRVPWQLLNTMDPSTKSVMGDFYKNRSIYSEKIEGMHFGAKVLSEGEESEDEIPMELYSWKEWEFPTYHERLKKSYYIIKDFFGEIE